MLLFADVVGICSCCWCLLKVLLFADGVAAAHVVGVVAAADVVAICSCCWCCFRCVVEDRGDRVSQSSSHYHTRPRPASRHAGTLTALHDRWAG